MAFVYSHPGFKFFAALFAALLLVPQDSSAQCTANFTYTQSGGVVTFFSTSTPQNSTTVISWTVAGGSTTFTNGTPVNVTYTANGIYTVIIQNNTTVPPCNTVSTQTVNVTSAPCNPVPSFTLTQGTNGQVFFTNLSSGATSYTWNFGNGQSSTVVSPSVTYSANGSYIASLTAVSGTCSATTSLFVNVSSYTCSAGFIYTVTPSGSATFSSTSVPNSTNNTYLWNFGNGSTLSVAGTPTAQQSYTSAGQYHVNLQLQTLQNCYDTAGQFITPCFLMSSFTATPGASGSVSFSNTSGYSAGTPSFTWNFGQGTTSQVMHPVHQYASNGTYTVTLSGTHGLCNSDTSMVIIVSNVPNCTVQASFSHTVGAAGKVAFQSTSSGLDSTHQLIWDFGDGHKGMGEKETHTYTNGGTHYARLLVSSTVFANCSDSVLQAINITGVGCNATAQFKIVPGQTPGTWMLVPQYPWNVSMATWSWGDGTSSNSMAGYHTYSSPGSYTICLTLTTSCGASASYCATHVIPAGSGGTLLVYVVNPVSSVGESFAGDGQLLVFPNPATDMIYLAVPLSGVLTHIAVTDLSGRTVLENERPPGELDHHSIDVSALPEGFYIINGQGGGSAWRCPLIIRKSR